MFKHNFDDMVAALAEDLQLDEAGQAKARAALLRYWHTRIAIVWSVEDLEDRPDLTEDQCIDVLQDVLYSHDAQHGVNWELIMSTADHLFGDAPDDDEEDG